MDRLVGIAKMAAEAPTLEAKRSVEYKQIAAKSYIARCDNPRMSFNYQINPYRGCEFGCKYCYARYTHEFMELEDSFETEIFAKQFSPLAFRKELAALPVGEQIALGTATDPYQPAERRYRITQQMLEEFALTAGFDLGITTKSDLVARDVALLAEVNRRHFLEIHMTVTTVETPLARLLEPMAPRPDLRLAAVKKLTDSGIRVRISCAPILPLINDSRESLQAVVEAGARAGAADVWGHVLFLNQSSQRVFFPFLAAQYPHLEGRYRERFARGAYLSGDYPEKISQRLKEIRRAHEMPKPRSATLPELWPASPQLTLFADS